MLSTLLYKNKMVLIQPMQKAPWLISDVGWIKNYAVPRSSFLKCIPAALKIAWMQPPRVLFLGSDPFDALVSYGHCQAQLPSNTSSDAPNA